MILRIINEEGYAKLWAGMSSSLLLCCNPAIQFAVYETIKKILIARKPQDAKVRALSGLQAFALGAFAKWIATVATYPLQVAQTRLRFGKSSNSIEYKGTFHCLRQIYKTGWPPSYACGQIRMDRKRERGERMHTQLQPFRTHTHLSVRQVALMLCVCTYN